MQFTGHKPEQLLSVLNYIAECDLPLEMFDAFLDDYAETRDLRSALVFALKWHQEGRY